MWLLKKLLIPQELFLLLVYFQHSYTFFLDEIHLFRHDWEPWLGSQNQIAFQSMYKCTLVYFYPICRFAFVPQTAQELLVHPGCSTYFWQLGWEIHFHVCNLQDYFLITSFPLSFFPFPWFQTDTHSRCFMLSACHEHPVPSAAVVLACTHTPYGGAYLLLWHLP